MTFEMWCEGVENLSFKNMSLQEKNGLEYKFFDFLRKKLTVDVAERRNVDEPSLSAPAGSIAQVEVRPLHSSRPMDKARISVQ